jgi:hypothetical protein
LGRAQRSPRDRDQTHELRRNPALGSVACDSARRCNVKLRR